MRARSYLSLTLLGGALGLTGAWLLTESPAPSGLPGPQAVEADSGAVSGSPATSEATLERAAAQVLDTPQGREFARRLGFQADYRAFLQQAPGLSVAEREARGAALQAEIERREAEGELALNEALLLQLGMAKVIYAEEAQQKAAVEQLMARYRQRSAEREALRQPDPHFAAYKQDEARIVAEVMALTSIPAGLSRDEYLRQRLQEAREQAYR